MTGYSFITGSIWRLKVNILRIQCSPVAERDCFFWKFPKLRPFVILLRVTGRWRRVWSICGVALTGENRSTRSTKSYISWPKPGRLWWEAGDIPLTYGVALKTKMISEPCASIINICGWMLFGETVPGSCGIRTKMKWVAVKFLGIKVPCTLGWPCTEGTC